MIPRGKLVRGLGWGTGGITLLAVAVFLGLALGLLLFMWLVAHTGAGLPASGD